MKNKYYEYLQSLDKEDLIRIIYQPHFKFQKLDFMSQRKIALRISYCGFNYSGLSEYKYGNTIGNHIKNALLISNLGDEITYAGRTDRGVSGVNMIASLIVKSRLTGNTDRYIITDEDNREFRYDAILNTYLPKDIRITGWAPVKNEFDARFSCIQRQYRYYFYKDTHDIVKMKEACNEILLLKNFYHLCKRSDPKARYERSVDVCEIKEDGDLFYLDIRARSFLHNMVRKIFWVLEKKGKGEEFDISNVGVASPYNLIFCKAKYIVELDFISNNKDNGERYKECIIENKIRSIITKNEIL